MRSDAILVAMDSGTLNLMMKHARNCTRCDLSREFIHPSCIERITTRIEDVPITIKIPKKTLDHVQVEADKFCKGNRSEYFRVAAANYIPRVEDFLT
jgi:hypothetical protein